jgi:Micrococcal nuclease (thermonuclease) homologs
MNRNKRVYFVSFLLLGCLLLISYKIVNDTNNSSKIEVQLSKCIDGDTARFLVNGEERAVRLLYIDTPEISNGGELYGDVAAKFTCDKLENAKELLIEYNPDGDQVDKYNRLLAWIFVDGKLLQTLIAKEGLVKKFYDYDLDYLYKEQIVLADKEAKNKKIGIYSKD